MRNYPPYREKYGKKGGHEVQRSAVTNSYDPFKDLQEGLNVVKAANPDMVPEGISAVNVINVDHCDVTAIALCITEDDILEQFCVDETVNDVAA